MNEKVYNKFVLSKKEKSPDKKRKINEKGDYKKKKRDFLILPIKRIYRLISWEKPESSLNRMFLFFLRYIFAHMILIKGEK